LKLDRKPQINKIPHVSETLYKHSGTRSRFAQNQVLY
jgi:hypothetical protein